MSYTEVEHPPRTSEDNSVTLGHTKGDFSEKISEAIR